jgi:hypothetical protein
MTHGPMEGVPLERCRPPAETTSRRHRVQTPGYADEDRSGGFEHGGWHLPPFDDTSRKWVVEGLTEERGSHVLSMPDVSSVLAS